MTRKAAPRAAAAKAPPDDIVETFDVEQGGEDWHALRRGIPTASRFATIMALGKDGGASLTRAKLLRVLAGEILSGQTAETYRNEDMDRGNAMEDEICDRYGQATFLPMACVGFVRRTIASPVGGEPHVVGASPDRYVGSDGVLEVKSMRPDLLIEVAEKGASGFPTEHRAQCHGTLWVTGRKWIDLQLGYRGMKLAPRFRVERDEAYIAQIKDAVDAFSYELRHLVTKMRAMEAKS